MPGLAGQESHHPAEEGAAGAHGGADVRVQGDDRPCPVPVGLEVVIAAQPAKHLGGQGLHGFADFQQPDADSVEYQAIGQIAS